MMIAPRVAVAFAPVPIPLPVPTLKPLTAFILNGYSTIAWQPYLASDHRSGPMFCLLTGYDLGWMAINSLEARGSKNRQAYT